jgi:hypothetical protein
MTVRSEAAQARSASSSVNCAFTTLLAIPPPAKVIQKG